MSPTSYQLLYPAMLSAKVRRIFLKSKFSCRTCRTLLGSAGHRQTLPSPVRVSGVCRLQQGWQNQRTLIWLSILARTLALVQSLSLDSRTASSLWPYPPTIDRSRPRQNQQTPADSCGISGPQQNQQTPAESADLDLAVHPCENLGACAVLEPGQQDGLVALAISADH